MGKFLRATLPVITGVMLLVIGTPLVSSAKHVHAPEIDPTTGIAAGALLAAVVLVIRGRRKQ